MIESIIWLLVGAATFLVGMNMMSGGLKKSTGKSVKQLFKKTESNRYIGMGIGAATTALIQSSAATSVIIFANSYPTTVIDENGKEVVNIVYNSLSIGQMSALLTYGIQILSSLMFLSMILVMMFMSLESIKRVSEVLEEEPTIVNPDDPIMDVKGV